MSSYKRTLTVDGKNKKTFLNHSYFVFLIYIGYLCKMIYKYIWYIFPKNVNIIMMIVKILVSLKPRVLFPY